MSKNTLSKIIAAVAANLNLAESEVSPIVHKVARDLGASSDRDAMLVAVRATNKIVAAQNDAQWGGRYAW